MLVHTHCAAVPMFTLKCFTVQESVVCAGWESEDDFGSSLLSEASGGGAQVSMIQQQLGSPALFL